MSLSTTCYDGTVIHTFYDDRMDDFTSYSEDFTYCWDWVDVWDSAPEITWPKYVDDVWIELAEAAIHRHTVRTYNREYSLKPPPSLFNPRFHTNVEVS